MKKIFVFILLFFLFCPIDTFSQEKRHKTAKHAKIETVSKKRAKTKAVPKNKKDQKQRQKARIENNKPEKINSKWKK